MRKIRKIMGIFFACFVLIAAQVSAQTVKGKVLDERGDPIIGANVIEKGTRNGTITDANGIFLLKIAPNTTILTVSYVGFQTKDIKIEGRNNLTIRLQEENKDLSEVVVVGYAKQRKATLTGAVSSVQGTALTERSVASLSTALEGTMPGVTIQQTSGEPGADGANIRIRGIGSINSTTFPLVLVDGVETSDINQVDMSTVESVSVLKDAASASIYGSRASNGVIIITTKRGKEGKINVTYNGYATMQRPVNMPEPVPAWQYLQSELDSWDNAGISVTPDTRTQRLQLIQDEKNYKPDNWNRFDTDWKSATLKNEALMQNHTVSISGGNANLKYYSAGSYLYQNGLIANNNYSRATLRVNADATLTKWAKFSLESNVRQGVSITPGVSSPKAIINTALYLLPTLSGVKDLDGNWGYGKNGLNPVAEAQNSGTNTNIGSEVALSGTLTVTPITNLDISGQYSLRKTDSRSSNYTQPYEVSLKGIDLGQYPPVDAGMESLSETMRNYYRLQATYNYNIAKHKFNLLAGTQVEDNLSTNFYASKQGYNLGRYYLDNGDGSTASDGGGASDWAMQSYYGRLNYNFDEKYLVEVNGRYDGSSRFTSQNRWGFFPSISAGWVISQESFMKNTQSYLNQLKLRASYGLLGNQDIGNYPYTATVNTGYSYWFNKQLSSGVAQTALANSNIKWEKSKQTDVGIDAVLWNGKLSITADYYMKDVYDMLMQFALPYYAGMQPAYSNAGDMINRGWEVVVSHKNKIGEFSYGASFTLSDNQNKITNLNGKTPTDAQTVGYPLNGMWGYLSDGYFLDANDVANSLRLSSAARPGFIKYKDANLDGVLDSKDRVYLGDSYPHFEYGLKLDGAWRGFDLLIFIQGVGQRKAYMSGVGLKPFANGANLFTHQLDSWTPDNPNAAYPILLPEANSADNFVMSDKWVRDGSYARLKNLILGYNIPKSWCQKAQLGSVRIYLSGQNLFTLSHFYKGYDPEVLYGGSIGGEFYPIMQTYTFGVDLKF